jgi:DNA-binding response OmpR family regulator
LKVLLVDDDRDFREITRLSLLAEGYQVFEASSGREAMNMARQIQPDLILLDILMPGLDGYATCRQLKTNPATNRIAIIILTALGDPTVRFKAKQAGADDYIAKPVMAQELRDRVRRLLDRYELFHGIRRRAEEGE